MIRALVFASVVLAQVAQAQAIAPGRYAGAAACASSGRYRLAVAGDTARLATIADSCDGRRNAITSAAWIRVRDALVLTHATLLDITGTLPRSGMTLVLRDGQISALYPDGTEPLPADGAERNLNGAFVLPGLIDALVHVATNPSVDDRRERTEARLKAALLGGVLAVRDMGGDARMLADRSRAVTVGDLAGPEMRYSAIMAGPGVFGDPRMLASSVGVPPGQAPCARAITDSTDLRQVVAEARGAGVTAIKQYADVGPRLVARALDFVRAAHAAGVRIAGTRTSAEALGMGASHGTIAVGKAADLLVLRADPTADIRNTRQIELVLKRGRIVER